MKILRPSAVVLIALCACNGPKGDPGATGPKGDTGPTGPMGGTVASVSGITPLGVWAGRNAEIQISGNNTKWDSTTTLSFGAGITVNKTTVASATALVAEITVAPDAVRGPRDITVGDANMDAFKGAFHVDSPVSFANTGGTLAQGSIVAAKLRSLDSTNPFDTTSTGDGFFTPLVFTNIAVDAGTGITASINNVTETEIDLQLLIDVTAPAGDVTFTVTSGNPSGPASNLVVSQLPSAFTVAARTAMPLTSGTMATVTTTNPLDSSLFSTSAAGALSLYDITASSTDVNAAPAAYIIPASGKWADLVGAANGAQLVWLAQPGDTFSAVLYDSSGEATTYQVLHTATTVAAHTNEVPAASTIATAQSADALPYVMEQGLITGTSYQHVIKFTLAAGDVGKKIHLGTVSAGDPLTDTVVELRGGDGGVSGSIITSDDYVYLDDVVSDPTTSAGDYWMVITPSPVFDPMHHDYDAYIRLEQ